ncbi:MAG: hypothetical protein R2708_03980 [Vicinamibacterales bacterium]
MQATRSTTVNSGEMPVGGAAASVRDIGADATSALRLVTLQREREERLKAEAEARRQQELEGLERTRRSPLLPFEDFDTAATFAATGGPLVVTRGLIAGPGDYDLVMAWAEPPARSKDAPSVHLITHRLSLPAATSDFGISDVIVADTVTPLATPYSSVKQAAHPYAFGLVEALPARDSRLSADGSLGLMYQVVNAAGNAGGAPDVEVAFQVYRTVNGRDEPFARLQEQRHDDRTLPEDFDVGKGHPLFGAVRAPLATFPRGRYRVEVTALDHLTGRRVSTSTPFEVVGTPASLLREAPRLGQPFRRERLLEPGVLTAMADALRPASPSEGLARLLADAAAGRFPALIRNETVAPGEQGHALALRALGLYGLGDSPRAVGALVRQATTQGAPTRPLGVLRGAVAALGGDDRTAADEWRATGFADAGLTAVRLDALLRMGRTDEATSLAEAAQAAAPADPAMLRTLAAVHLAAGRHRLAVDTLDRRPAGSADPEADFLMVQALFASLVAGPGPVQDGRERFDRAAGDYITAGGRHADLVGAWRAAAADVLRR